jgi:hypothetical protein
MGDSERPALDQRKAEQLEDALDRAKKRTDHLTATYADLSVNVAAVFRLEVGLRVLQQTTPSHVVPRVLSDGGPRRPGDALTKPDKG